MNSKIMFNGHFTNKHDQAYSWNDWHVSYFVIENADDFLPFLTTESGDLFTQSDFDKYCCDLEKTTTWGGHLEIKALSHVLNQPIIVMQSNGPVITVGEGCHGDPVTVVYHRHAFGLGEHYNSVELLQEQSDM